MNWCPLYWCLLLLKNKLKKAYLKSVEYETGHFALTLNSTRFGWWVEIKPTHWPDVSSATFLRKLRRWLWIVPFMNQTLVALWKLDLSLTQGGGGTSPDESQKILEQKHSHLLYATVVVSKNWMYVSCVPVTVSNSSY